MFLEAPSAQTELLLLYLNVVPPAPQEPVAPPALGELAVAWPLVQPGGGLQQPSLAFPCLLSSTTVKRQNTALLWALQGPESYK